MGIAVDDSKGRGKATCYIPGSKLTLLPKDVNTQVYDVSAQVTGINTHGSCPKMFPKIQEKLADL